MMGKSLRNTTQLIWIYDVKLAGTFWVKCAIRFLIHLSRTKIGVNSSSRKAFEATVSY